VKYRVKVRNPVPDEEGRKVTAVEFVSASNHLLAGMRVLKDYQGWELLKVEEV
jgi:hypothetical protein